MIQSVVISWIRNAIDVISASMGEMIMDAITGARASASIHITSPQSPIIINSNACLVMIVSFHSLFSLLSIGFKWTCDTSECIDIELRHARWWYIWQTIHHALTLVITEDVMYQILSCDLLACSNIISGKWCVSLNETISKCFGDDVYESSQSIPCTSLRSTPFIELHASLHASLDDDRVVARSNEIIIKAVWGCAEDSILWIVWLECFSNDNRALC